MIHRWSIARRLFVAHLLFMVALTAIVGTATFVDARDHAYDEAGRRMAGIATTVADAPFVLAAAGTADPSALLQPYALKIMKDADADFVTIMAPDRTRWTHPRDEELGKPYIGSIDAALNGQVFTEVTAGTLGPSVRTIAPVKDADGKVRALVAAGVTVRTVDVAVSGRLPALLAIALALLVGGSVASWLLGRYLRRVTRGWGPEQLGQLFAYYESVLHSVREGVILIDPKGKVVIYNDQAAELLGLRKQPSEGVPVAGTNAAGIEAAGAVGSGAAAGGAVGGGAPAGGAAAGARQTTPSLSDLPLAPSLKELFESGRTAHDEIHLTGSRILVVNQGPAVGPASDGPSQRGSDSAAPARGTRVYGTVATIRDRTEIESLGSELETMRTLSDALRAQTHEHANRLHTIVSLMELGRTPEALDFATKDLELSQRLTDDIVSSIEEPVLGALIMGKAAEAHERGVELILSAGGSTAVTGLAVQDLVAILGNLLDNAIDAAAEAPPPRLVELTVETTGSALEITVEDSGPGIDPAAVEDVFRHGFSTKAAGTVRTGPGPGPGPPGRAAPGRYHDNHQPRRSTVPRHAAGHNRGTAMSDIRVLVVEDEPIAAAAHAAYVERLDGFTLAGSAPDGQSALRLLTEFAAAGNPVELVLLDMNLPDLHGLDIARRMRAAGLFADIIAITAVRELNIVRSAVATGVVQYLIKPFTYATFADKLASYRLFREQLASPRTGSAGARASQSDVDQAFASLRAPSEVLAAQGPGRVHAGIRPGLHQTAGRGGVSQRGHGGARHVPGHCPALPRVPRRRRYSLPRRALRRPRPAGERIPLEPAAASAARHDTG